MQLQSPGGVFCGKWVGWGGNDGREGFTPHPWTTILEEGKRGPLGLTRARRVRYCTYMIMHVLYVRAKYIPSRGSTRYYGTYMRCE